VDRLADARAGRLKFRRSQVVGMDMDSEQESHLEEKGNRADTVVSRRAEAYAARVMTSPRVREITPADGSAARLGEHVSVYCAPCQRWIDCHQGIPPVVAGERHGELFH
jgi:hypothetical protein